MVRLAMLIGLSIASLAACAPTTLEGQATVPGVVELEADAVDLDVQSTWTESDHYGSSEFIDVHALVVNHGENAATFTVFLTLINEARGHEGVSEGDYEMATEYVVEPGEEVEVYEGILGGPEASVTCSWQLRVQVADNYKVDVDRENNKGRSNIFEIGG